MSYSFNITNESKVHFIQQTILKEKDNKYNMLINTIIDKYNLEHSSNKNGIFLNLSILDEDIIDDIYNHFIESKNSIQKSYEEVVLQSNNTVNSPKKKDKPKKDKLNFEKFDTYLLQSSRTNLSI
jgi:hypothetical protein